MIVNLTGTSFEASSLNLSQPTISDLDLDGYPDIVMPIFSHSTSGGGLESEGDGETTKPTFQRPLVLLGSAGGRLHPQWELFNEAAVTNVTQVAFFDLWEDVSGKTYVLYTSKLAPGENFCPLLIIAWLHW
jgi:hypothetical protein